MAPSVASSSQQAAQRDATSFVQSSPVVPSASAPTPAQPDNQVRSFSQPAVVAPTSTFLGVLNELFSVCVMQTMQALQRLHISRRKRRAVGVVSLLGTRCVR